MSHESGHTDLESFGGFQKGIWVVVRRPTSAGGLNELDPESYHQLVHQIGGSNHGPVVGLLFLLGHSEKWQDSIRWEPSETGEDWQKLQYMLDPDGINGREILQDLETGIRVAGLFECGYGGYTHPMRDALGVDDVRRGLGKLTQETVLSSVITPPGVPPPDALEPSEAGLIWPCCGTITTTCAGHTSRGPGSSCAYDIDCGDSGEPIVAAHAGRVTFAGGNPAVGYGMYVDIVDAEKGLGTRYAHMLSPHLVTVGQEVAQGQVIGLMGSTGRSTGPHVHFEIHTPVTGSGDMNVGTAVDPASYLPPTCANVPVGELPLGVQAPTTSYTVFTVTGLDGTVIEFVGDRWIDGDDTPTPVWTRLQQILLHIHWRSLMLGPSPTISVLPAAGGDAWEPIDAFSASNGHYFLSPRNFWAPRVLAANGSADIVAAWKNWAFDPEIGLSYGRCELMVDLTGANPTHLANMHSFASSGVDVTGLRTIPVDYVDTITSGILFLDDADKIISQGLESTVQGLDKTTLEFWNYGNRWDQLVAKWVIYLIAHDMDVLGPDGQVVTEDNEPGTMPPMIVGDFWGRITIERLDWKTGDRLPNLMWFETATFKSGQVKPPGFRDWADLAGGTPANESEFGDFKLEEIARDGTFNLKRHPFPPDVIDHDTSGGFVLSNEEEEIALFGSAGLYGIHGWHVHFERGIGGEGFMNSPDFWFFPVDPRLMDKDQGVIIPQSPLGTLGDIRLALRANFPEIRGKNAQPLSQIIMPKSEAGGGLGIGPKIERRALILPSAHTLQVVDLSPAPGPFVPAPILPYPGDPPFPPGTETVYLTGSTTVLGPYTVNNTILNLLYSMLIGSGAPFKGNYQLAWYIALMLHESGGDPLAVGICLTGLGHAIGLFQLLTGIDPECPGVGGMGHPYTKDELHNPVNNVNIARNALLDLWTQAVAASGGEPPTPGAVQDAFGPNPWEATSNAIPTWLAIREGISDLTFPLPE